MDLDIRDGVFLDPSLYEVTKSTKWEPTKTGFRNTYSPNYLVHLTDSRVNFKICVGEFETEKEAQDFIASRTTPVEVPSTTIHSDMCRCGALYNKVEYAITENIVWKRHTLCGRPISHKDMMDLNSLAVKDFDLDSLFD